MAWTTTMTTMVRIYINDTEATQKYTDVRLQNLIAVAAFYVKGEIDFTTAYAVSIDTPSISPDPTLAITLDDTFTGFVVLRAACIADQSTFRTEAFRSNVEARCGKSLLKTSDRTAAFSELLNQGPCALYEQAKLDYEIGNAQACQAILSPFSGPNVDPLNIYVEGGSLEMHR